MARPPSGAARVHDLDLSDGVAGLLERQIELPVSPFGSLVVARVVAILGLAALAYSFDDGVASNRLALAALVVAALQPVLPVFWRSQRAYRQAQMLTDIASFGVFVLIAPDYYWVCAIVVGGIVGNHAVLANVRSYATATVLALVVMTASGAFAGVENYERGVAVIAILALGLGYLGANIRASMRASRGDLLDALGAAGGLAHLTDLQGGVIDVVGDTDATVGWPRDEWLFADHRSIVHPDDIDEFWVDEKAIVEGTLIDRTARIRTKDGRWMWLRDISRVVMHQNRPHLRGFSIDVSAHQDGLSRVTSEAATDVLTGLRNRRALLVELEDRSVGVKHHLVLIDLNRFKEVNDTLGHDAGDVLLQIVADRLTKCLRPGDVLARLGGDEFAIIIDDLVDHPPVTALVDRIAFEVSRPAEVAGVRITTSISAGIVTAVAGASGSAMLRRADIAMYAAKRRQVNSAVFDDELEQSSQRRTVLSRELPDALESQRLTLHYQPIVETVTQKIVSVEGLARWDHPTFGLLSPDAFLEVVLLSDRSGDFTRRMVGEAIETARQIAASDSDVTVAVNLPIRTLQDIEFGDWFAASCLNAGVSPNRLVFEIAERDIHDTASITTAIDRLSALGVVVAVDDFGSGHATFERLRWRGVSQLKLDRELVSEAASNDRERAVLRSIVELADRLGYDVVAEGVETVEQLALLKELGCSHAQGYLFAAAMARTELLDQLARSAAPTEGRTAVLGQT